MIKINSELLHNRYLLKKRAGAFIYSIVRGLLVFGLCFLILQPLFDKISVSFMAELDLYDPTVISIPRNFSLSNYSMVNELMSYWRTLFITFGVVASNAVFQVAACTLAAYGFARFKFPLKKFWFACVMVTIIVPPQTIMAPLYLNFRFFDVVGLMRLFTGEPINLLNNIFGYYLMSITAQGLKSGLYIFMLRQYFRGLPRELEEAAWVDGCGKLRTFAQIMLPDAVPMITSCFLFSFVWQWTDTFYTNLFLTNFRVFALTLSGLTDNFRQWYPNVYDTPATIGLTQAVVATGVLMCLAPLVLLYLFAQRMFVRSLAQTGLKM
jgi:multiple sugar transport system permease protein